MDVADFVVVVRVWPMIEVPGTSVFPSFTTGEGDVVVVVVVGGGDVVSALESSSVT